ncbi:MAG: 50S ribosomal protein L10 [Acidimicrobiia bacterium]|nr:50S ribosomal protein L10 [Acidimicrobiia bacterium]
MTQTAEGPPREMRSEPRPEKIAEVERISERLTGSTAVLLAEYRGLTVDQQQKLRRSLRESGAEFNVVKCSLARLAADKAGHPDLVPLLEGPIALVFCDADVSQATKALVNSAKEMEALVVKGAVLEGAILSAADTKALAALPSREELLAQLAGVFTAPAQNVASLIAAPLRDVANLVSALEEKKTAAGEAA